jgi:hypothetical protein
VARTVVQRFLHEPTIRLKSLGASGVHGRLALLRELFGLDELAGADPPAATPEQPPATTARDGRPEAAAGERDRTEHAANVRPLHRRAQS